MSLTASLTIEPAEADAPEAFVARCRLVNQGDQVVGINQAALSSPSLALEITDAAGEPVLLPPPPVPSESPPIQTLEASEETAAEFAGFLPSWTEPGAYRARCRYAAGSGEPIHSAWVEFTLSPRPID
jgi:hypothetical protein